MGEINQHDKIYPGEHAALLSQDVSNAVQAQLGTNARVCHVQSSADPASEQDQMRRLIDLCAARIIVERPQIVVKLTGEIAAKLGNVQLEIPWNIKSKRPEREILMPHADPSKDNRPVHSEVRVSIVKAVALGRQWLSETISGRVLDAEALTIRKQRRRLVGPAGLEPAT